MCPQYPVKKFSLIRRTSTDRFSTNSFRLNAKLRTCRCCFVLRAFCSFGSVLLAQVHSNEKVRLKRNENARKWTEQPRKMRMALRLKDVLRFLFSCRTPQLFLQSQTSKNLRVDSLLFVQSFCQKSWSRSFCIQSILYCAFII